MSAANVSKNRQLKPGRKMRIPLSCEPCRSRKLKCNREQPCQNCIVRQNSAGCVFRGADKASAGGTRSAKASGMQQRIDRLEGLVTNLMAQGEMTRLNTPLEEPNGRGLSPTESNDYSTALPEQLPSAVQHGMGVMTVNETSSVYRGTTHWHDLLKELNDLKSYWGQVQDEEEDIIQHHTASDVFEGPSLFCGVIQPIGMEEILATLPAKPAADKMMKRFFDDENSPVPTFHFLHKPTFMKEYETHWADPKQTKVMWIGLLFALLSQTMTSYDMSGDEPPEYMGVSQSRSELYRLRSAQCLMLGDVSKCSPYTLETLVFYTMAEWARKGQNAPRIWMMGGMMVRVALQMGYHRDPSHYPNITPFQGEMRRRLWHFVYRGDSLTSFLIGLPSMLRATEQDTAEPRNLHDWELTEDMSEIPPSRPLSESTPVSYMITKSQILAVIGRIVEFMSSLKLYDYERVLEMDHDLERAFQEMPDYLKMRDDPDAYNDNPSILNRRIQLVFLYHQGMCVLHRKFVAQGRSDERFSPSRSRCIGSAMALLTQQYYLYVEAKIKKSMASHHWYRASYTTQEYILAAMIVVLEIRQRELEPFEGDADARAKEQGEMRLALQKACLVWYNGDNSHDSAKVYKALSSMLTQLPGSPLQPEDIPFVSDFPTLQVPGSLATDYNAAFIGDTNIDWSAWDTFVEGSSFDDVYGSMPF